MARGRHDIGSLRREEDTAMIRLRGIIPAIAAEALLTVLLDRLVGTPVAWALLIALPMALVLLLLLSTPAGIEPSWSAPPTPPSAAGEWGGGPGARRGGGPGGGRGPVPRGGAAGAGPPPPRRAGRRGGGAR